MTSYKILTLCTIVHHKEEQCCPAICTTMIRLMIRLYIFGAFLCSCCPVHTIHVNLVLLIRCRTNNTTTPTPTTPTTLTTHTAYTAHTKMSGSMRWPHDLPNANLKHSSSKVADRIKAYNNLEERSRFDKFSSSVKSKIRTTAEQAGDQVNKYVVKQAIKHDLVHIPRMPANSLMAINGDDFHSRDSYLAVVHDAIDHARTHLPKGHSYTTDSEGRQIGVKPKTSPEDSVVNGGPAQKVDRSNIFDAPDSDLLPQPFKSMVSPAPVSAKRTAGQASGMAQHPTILRPAVRGKKDPRTMALSSHPPDAHSSSREDTPIYHVPIEQDIKGETWHGTGHKEANFEQDQPESLRSKDDLDCRKSSNSSNKDFAYLSCVHMFRRPSSDSEDNGKLSQNQSKREEEKTKRRHRTTQVYEYNSFAEMARQAEADQKPNTARQSNVGKQAKSTVPVAKPYIKRKPLPSAAEHLPETATVPTSQTLSRKPGMNPLATSFQPYRRSPKPVLNPEAGTFQPNNLPATLQPGFRTLDPKAAQNCQTSGSAKQDELFLKTSGKADEISRHPTPLRRSKPKVASTKIPTRTMPEYIRQRSQDNKADKSRSRYNETIPDDENAIAYRDQYRQRKRAQSAKSRPRKASASNGEDNNDNV